MRRWLGCALALSLGLFGCGDDGPNGGEPPEGGLPDVDVPDVGLDGSPDATPDGSPGDGAADGGDGSAPDGATDGSTQPPAEPWYVLSPERAGPFVILSDDGREFERIAIASEAAGSARGVEAGEGVFYFEMQTLVSDRRQRFGVGPADMPLEGDVGDHPGSLGATETGVIFVNGVIVEDYVGSADTFGFVVDRREETVIHLVIATPAHPQGEIVASVLLDAPDGPLHAFVSGPRLALGPQARYNAGHDTTNFPFRYDARAALAAVDPGAAEELVLGFGDTGSKPWNEPPVVTLTGPSSALPGEGIALVVSAHDAEDGDLTARVIFEDDALPHSARAIQLEPGGVYRTSIVGRHRLRASVVDAGGKRTTAVHVVDVAGAPTMHAEVRLVNAPGDGALIDASGRGVRFTQVTKDGVRANQGLIDDFWYFEVSHVGPYGNFGTGIVVEAGSIAPYALRAVPASMSMNFISGIWHDIIWVASQPEGGPHQTVGFAVDYRRSLPNGRDYPIVHVIVAGVLAASVHVDDATTPVHPMLYGTMGDGTGPQLVANFGTSPFVYDARAILSSAGYDGNALKRGWGVHAH